MTQKVLPPHVVVLVHGNNGAPDDYMVVEEALRRRYAPEELLIIKSSANHTITSHGVEAGGTRLAEEVANTMFAHDLNPLVRSYKFSMVGHSLGGLYARYAIVKVMESLSILPMEYVSFVTLCTPHMGSRRPVSESRLKNLWRLGVHTVLASASFYGATGVDLLLEPPRADPNTVPPESEANPPVLEKLCDPQLPFLTALKKFRFCTLVAITDGDVLVPYASASIRNFNPYPGAALTSRFTQWRWHIHHSGFAASDPALLKKLDAHVDSIVPIEHLEHGVDISASTQYQSDEVYSCDNKREVEFKDDMMLTMQRAVPWRRIDVSVEPGCVKGKMRLHDWPINKSQPPECRSTEFIELFCDILGSDHQISNRSAREVIPENQPQGFRARLSHRRSYSVPSVLSTDFVPEMLEERLSDGRLSLDEREWELTDSEASLSNMSTDSFSTARAYSPRLDSFQDTSNSDTTVDKNERIYWKEEKEAGEGETHAIDSSKHSDSGERGSEVLTDTSSVPSPQCQTAFSITDDK